MIIRTIQCAVCGKEEKEKGPGEGWPGWGGMKGVVLDGHADPDLCPEHLTKVMDYIDSLVEK